MAIVKDRSKSRARGPTIPEMIALSFPALFRLRLVCGENAEIPEKPYLLLPWMECAENGDAHIIEIVLGVEIRDNRPITPVSLFQAWNVGGSKGR